MALFDGKRFSVPGTIKKSLSYLKFNGVDGVMSQVRYKMTGPGLAYNNWYKEKHEADAEELQLQRETHFEYEPLISIIVPVYMTPEFFLRSMIESVLRQSYGNWQLCIVDGSQADKADASDDDNQEEVSVYERLYSRETERIVRQYMEQDERIKYHLMEENLGISDNTNAGIDMSSGSYIAFLEHDDILTDDALFRIVEALQENKYEFIYTDEDKMSEDGSKYSDPSFKPDFSIDLIRSTNYIHRFVVVSKKLALEVGGLHREFDGGQSYDFILRCIEKTRQIKHVSRVLYHYRIHSRTLASHTKEYAREMEKKALAAHIKRSKLYATLGVSDTPGLFKVNYETPGNPYLSIIIPGGENADNLNRCLSPLFELARYSNFEIIIIDQDGTNETMLKFYHRMERIRRNIKVVVNKDADSLPQLRNYGAARARGEYILFLDSNVEILDVTAIGEMLGICMRDDVGIVSGVLYNDNNTTYHEGYVVGINGIYDHLYRGLRKTSYGYLMYNKMNRDLSAVSASCMMVKKNLYAEVGGFFEGYRTELAAVDFCLKIRELDKLVVCAVDAGWRYHSDYIYEPAKHSVVTPAEQPQEDYIKQVSEDDIFDASWHHIIEDGDPYYNINFARDGELFSLL